MTDMIYSKIDDDNFHLEKMDQQRRERDKFEELLHHPDQSGDDSIDKLIKAAMPIVNGDNMGDLSDLSSKSTRNSKPVESQSLRKIFIDEKEDNDSALPFSDKKKRD